MNKEKQYMIAMVLFTNGIDYDDRIRKEMISVRKLFPNVSFKIFAIEDGKNKEISGISSYGIPYRKPYLKTRDKYASGTHKFTKAWDFFRNIRHDLKHFDAIWCADCETFLFVLLSFGKKIIWDLHELPWIFMKSTFMKILFRFLERKVDVMIHANGARLKYLKNNGYVSNMDKQFVLNNYPQFNEVDDEYDDEYRNFEKWLGGEKCVYLQGISNPDRADVESIEAVLRKGLKAVVVGRISKGRMKIIEEKIGSDKLYSNVFFAGQLKQLKTPQYIKKCFMTLVFYKKTSFNNWYCEPNRLYQNIINGNPAVVGNNPPMKALVESRNYGVVVDTDGSDVDKIVEGIERLLMNHDSIKNNTLNSLKHLQWDSQNNIIQNIVSLL